MYAGHFIFSRIMAHPPWKAFRRCVVRHRGNRKVKSFACSRQRRATALAQLLQPGSLRDIGISLRAHADKPYHIGLAQGVSRSTPANASRVHSWKIHSDSGCRLIAQAQSLYGPGDFQPQSDQPAHALDSSTTDPCLSLFPRGKFRNARSGVKMHALSDMQGSIPGFVGISEAKPRDAGIPDQMPACAGALCVMDRACLGFRRLCAMRRLGGRFIVRAKSDTRIGRLYSHRCERAICVICDRTVRPAGAAASDYPQKMRRIGYCRHTGGRRFRFLTSSTDPPALTIAELYKNRWQAETFFKRVKRRLRIKSFYGTGENAARTQIRIAVSVYVPVAILKKRLNIRHSLYRILQIISVSAFEKKKPYQPLADHDYGKPNPVHPKQLFLFD